MPCQVDFKKHGAAGGTRDTPACFSAPSRSRRGVARGLLAAPSSSGSCSCRPRPLRGAQGAGGLLPSSGVGSQSSLKGQGPHAVVLHREQVLITTRSLMTYGYLRLACSRTSDHPRRTTPPARRFVVSARLQNAVHTTRQRTGDGRLGHVRYFASP